MKPKEFQGFTSYHVTCTIQLTNLDWLNICLNSLLALLLKRNLSFGIAEIFKCDPISGQFFEITSCSEYQIYCFFLFFNILVIISIVFSKLQNKEFITLRRVSLIVIQNKPLDFRLKEALIIFQWHPAAFHKSE